MADWDGLRRDLEDSVSPPPLTALRERRRRRQQRRAIATTCAVVMVGSASGVALLGRAAQRERAGTNAPTAAALDRIVNSDKLPPPRDYEAHVVTDVDFVSPTAGFAIGLRCTGDACDVATWRTTDGGRTWSAPSDVATGVPRRSFHEEDPAGGAVRSIRMADERTGYAFNPDLYVTGDGGLTWRRARQPSKVTSVSVVGGTAWFAQRGCAAGADCDLVLRTAAAGTGTLRDADLPETNGAAAVVRRAGDRDGYLLSWDAPDAPHAAFHRTRDGGRTWTAGTMPCQDALAASLSAGAGRPLWLVCTTATGRRAFQSSDHGTTWRRLADPPADGVVTDLVARTGTDAYLATQTPGALYVTDDGGETWRPVDGAGRAYGYSNLDVADAGHAWAMGDAGHLWRTTDGARWERLALPPGAPTATPEPTPRGLRERGVRWTGLSFTDARRGHAVGHRCAADTCRAVVRRTVDGGDTWQPLADPPARWPAADGQARVDYVDRVTFADDRHGRLYGRALYATADGGATWTKVRGVDHVTAAAARGDVVWAVGHRGCGATACDPTIHRGPVAGPPRPLGGYESGEARGTFAALDERHAYFAAADDGGKAPVFAGTADGGATWTAYDRPCATSFTALAAYAPGGLWLVCGAPAHSADSHAPQTLARSADGGRTWTRTELPGEGAVVGEIVALSATRAWRTGANYGLLSTDDAGRTWQAVRGVGKAVALTFADAAHGWVLADDALWRTTDGATWERLG